MSEFEILFNLNWFILGVISSFAIEIVKLRKEERNLYEEGIIAGKSFVDINKISYKKIIFIILYAAFGGFFVMILEPNNIVTAIIIAAAWDKFLVSNIEEVFGHEKKS